jgi:hypothetical protein
LDQWLESQLDGLGDGQQRLGDGLNNGCKQPSNRLDKVRNRLCQGFEQFGGGRDNWLDNLGDGLCQGVE